MNIGNLTLFGVANATIVIDVNGQIRELLPGQTPAPGEVVVTVDDGNPDVPNIQADITTEDGGFNELDLEGEIAQIFEQLEQGVDPTANDDFATAAGGQNGSSPTGTGTVERDGVETIAETQFDTEGLQSQGLSETQSLALFNTLTSFIGDVTNSEFETDSPVTITGIIEVEGDFAAEFIEQVDTEGTNGDFSIDSEGNWTFVANSPFNELYIGDTITEVFTVAATDGTTQDITVTINGTNDAPAFAPNDGEQYSFSYLEGAEPGQVLGTVGATDPDNEVLAYSISSNIQNESEEDLFSIDALTGEISLTEAGAIAFSNDFEQLSNLHALTVTVTEVDKAGTPQAVDVTVELTELNIDDNAPVFEDEEGGPVEGYSFEYNENSLVTDVLGQVAAVDADGEDVTYSITQNVYSYEFEGDFKFVDGFEGDFPQRPEGEPLFAIDELTGEITLTEAGVTAFTNDYERFQNLHDIVVTATEVAEGPGSNGLGPIQKETPINVSLSEINLDDNAPIFYEDEQPVRSYSFEYNENSAEDYVIGTVNAVDADGEGVTYSIKTNVFNDDEVPKALFEIDSESGQISLTEAGVAAFTNDFELDDNVHNLVVTATEDEGLGGVKTTDVNVQLSEINLDDNAPDFDDPDGEGYAFSYNENSAEDYVIGTVNAVDADGEGVTYSIKTNVFNDDEVPKALFEIDSESGQISLTEAGVAAFTNDFELDDNVHNLVVTATEDEGLGGVKTTDVNVQLSEINLDDNAPDFDDPDGEGYAFNYNENSAEDYVIGTVNAVDADGEGVTYSIKTNVFNDDEVPKALFEIDSESGQISLTEAGVAAFTNDFELDDNVHNLVVTATEDEGLGGVKTTDVNVQLSEINLDDNEPEFEQPDGYEFNYSENNVDTHAIGQVTASDADGEDVTYSISTNVYAADDVLEESPFFVIDSDDGEIRLTAEGVLAFTNDFELLNNVHNLVVTATEVGSFGGEPKSTDVNVVLNEINVNEAPEAEDFEAYLRDPDSPVPIVFDSNDPEFDHIWDTDEIIPGNNESVMVMITSLPSTGTLYYTDENDVRTELTELDLYTEGGGGTILDPSKVEYEQGEGDAFTIGGHPDDVEKTDGFYNWGDKESKTERRIDLDNETSIRVSVINDNGKPLKQYAADGHKGYGIGDKDGNGMNANEILVIDLSENPLEEITFGLDGMQQAFVHAQSIQVTYTLQDGTTQVEEYHKDSALGPHKFYEEFTYSSEDNPIVGMAMEGSGSNWVLRGFSGELAITEDDSFDYLAIDSGGLVSEEATVTIPPYVEHAATLEDELLSGTDDTDVFKWSDATINDGTDTIEDFNFYEDLIDLTGVLDDGSAVDIEDLMGIASAEVVDDDVVITVNADNSADEEVSQTIVITDGATILEDFIPTNSALDQLELLSQVLKTDAA